MTALTESQIEDLALAELQKVGFTQIYGPTIAPDADESPVGIDRRPDYNSVVLESILASSIAKLNPTLPAAVREHALKTVLGLYSPQLMAANEEFHRLLAEGVPVTVQIDGTERGERVWLVDFANPKNNVYHAINQFTITSDSLLERGLSKRPDIILFVNGLPIAVIELKNAADEQATIRKAYDQIKTYQATIRQLFFYNCLNVISDGFEARAGTISSAFSRYMAWKTRDGQKEAKASHAQLSVLIEGMLNPAVLLDLMRNFIVFEKGEKIDTKTGLMQIETIKKIAGYHQYYAVNKAVISTRKAAGEKGDRKAGVIWHTQGSGKSLSMVFYAGKLIRSIENPTIVVITDRNDLDEQLFDTFAASAGLLGVVPIQAASSEHLKKLLKVASGGLVFTTIQKFFPDNGQSEYECLSDRRNIVVIADEAHRTQYGFRAKLVDTKDEKGAVTGKRIAYGFAKYLRDAIPNATFIGFTGTPVESTDVNTPAIFGDYIDIYDIAQSVEDGATVRIYYESRLARVNLSEQGRQLLDEFDRNMDESGASEIQKAKAKWTKLEAIVGHPERIRNLARDIIQHYEKRAEVFNGKGMIVSMSRRIAVALYQEIVSLKPDWHHDDLKSGSIKVVMTSSSSDKIEFDPEDPDGLVIPALHRTNKENRRFLSERMKDAKDPLKMVIVRDMWLTGFDVPCLHTMYIDKLMKGHTLMQAIARVNRVFMDKPGGLIVDYVGIGNALKQALAFYANSGGKGKPAETQEQALELLQEKIEVVRQMLHSFDYGKFFTTSTEKKLSLILQAEEFILNQKAKERFIKETTALSQLFALVMPREEAMELADEIAFFQSVRARLLKFETTDNEDQKNYESAIRQIVNQAVESTQVVDVFDAAGLKKPEISLLSEAFLMEVQDMQHKNLALELLRKILNDEIRVRLKFNITEGKHLLEMLETSIKKYQNNLLTTAEIIEELVRIAQEVRNADGIAEKLNLSKDEFAFYSALEVNDSAVKVLGDITLRDIAREIAEKVRTNATIDWTLKESARAKLMVIVKRTLNKYGYPPDKQQRAVDTVLKQAEVLADYWVGETGAGFI